MATVRKINISMFRFRGGKTPDNAELQRILQERGRGGVLLEVGHNQFAMMRPEHAMLSTVSRRRVLMRRENWEESLLEPISDKKVLAPYRKFGFITKIKNADGSESLLLRLFFTEDTIQLLENSGLGQRVIETAKEKPPVLFHPSFRPTPRSKHKAREVGVCPVYSRRYGEVEELVEALQQRGLRIEMPSQHEGQHFLQNEIDHGATKEIWVKKPRDSEQYPFVAVDLKADKPSTVIEQTKGYVRNGNAIVLKILI